MVKILFVCLGNICRSPAAEGVMTQMVEDRGLSDKIFCDSSGTSALHAGSLADERMRRAATLRGYELTSISRKFIADDFSHFDYIITMDNDNYKNVMNFPEAKKDKVHKFVDFCTDYEVSVVPDPYHEGEQGFEFVMDLLENGCGNLLNQMVKDI